MALTPLKVGRDEGGFKEGKSRRVCYSFHSTFLRHRARRWGCWRQPDSAVAQSGSVDAGGG
jgi:hypothetical protein